MAIATAWDLRLVNYLRSIGWMRIVYGDHLVRQVLGMPPDPGLKCADALGFSSQAQ